MRELLLDRLIYVIDNPVLTLGISFSAGYLATRLAVPNRKFGWFVCFIIGLTGFFISYFLLSYPQISEYLDSLLALRVVIEFLAAFAASFAIAGIIHFIKPS